MLSEDSPVPKEPLLMEWMDTERIGIIVVIRTIAIVSAISNEVFFIRLMSRIFFINIFVCKKEKEIT